MPVLTLEEALPQASSQSWLDGFERELRLGFELEKANYMARQRLAQQEVKDNVRNVDGLGQLMASIDARTYFRWLQEDPHFWEDRGNVARFLKDNPECRAPKPERKARIIV